MPHLSQLQRDYKDKHVTIIGMTSVDKTNTLEAVREMVEAKGDGMDYTVAFDVERTTNAAWMKAAGKGGIPTSFLVDKSGKIAWIGHPAEADVPLAQVVAGTWDYEEGPALMERIKTARRAIYEAAGTEPKQALALFEQFQADYPAASKGMDSLHFTILSQLPDQVAAATRVGKSVIEHAIEAKNFSQLNAFAWGLVDPEVERENRFLDLALRAADKANELSGEKDGAILDTVARVHFWRGDLERAVKIQTRAVENSEGQMKASLELALAEYQRALEEQQKP
jgi:hypothetical protein